MEMKVKSIHTDILPPISDFTTAIAAPNLSDIRNCKEFNGLPSQSPQNVYSSMLKINVCLQMVIICKSYETEIIEISN